MTVEVKVEKTRRKVLKCSAWEGIAGRRFKSRCWEEIAGRCLITCHAGIGISGRHFIVVYKEESAGGAEFSRTRRNRREALNCLEKK